MKMPFGQHKGSDLANIPVSYLRWVLEDSQYATPALRAAIRAQLGIAPPTPPQANESVDAQHRIEEIQRNAQRIIDSMREKQFIELEQTRRATVEAVRVSIRSVYRELAMRYHPDHGGSSTAMIALNHMHERLEKTLTEAFRDIWTPGNSRF
jgi:hypothetical protein